MFIRVLVILLILPFAVLSQTQNLVPDSSFEDINTNAPFAFYMFDEGLNQWFSPNAATPDILISKDLKKSIDTNAKSKRKNSYAIEAKAPKTPYGFQRARSGNCFAGFIIYHIESLTYKEYLAIKLLTKLDSGKSYCLKMYLNLADQAQYYGIGVSSTFLTSTEIEAFRKKTGIRKSEKLSIDYNQLPLTPHIVFNLSAYRDTANWVPFMGMYTATGEEEYLIIGAKTDDKTIPAKTKIKKGKGIYETPFVYYFIDDVSLIEISDSIQCLCKKVVIDTIAKVVPIQQPLVVDTIPYIIPNLNFDTDSWDIKPEAFATLDSLVSYIQALKGYKVEVSGHTDDVGGDLRNMHLSENRAKSVAEYLIKKGVNKNIITHKGYGETVPITTTNKDQNRRVEIKLIKQ